MAPAARTGETPTDRVLPVSSGAAGNSSCALSPLETLESLCLDCLLSLLDFRDFCNLSLVSSSLRAALLTDLSRQARCVSGLVLHCLCDTPVFPPLGELSFEGTLSSAGHAPSGRNVSVSTEARKERTCQGTSARPTPSRRCVERSSELDSDLVSPAEPGLPLGGGAPLVSRSASKQLPCRRKAPPFPLGLKPWKAAALVSKRLFSLRVGVDAFAAMPLPLWETLLRANAATLREVSLCSPLRWTSQRQQQHRQREVLEFLCSLQSSAHVQGGSEALYAPHPPLSPRFFSFGDRCSERLPPPARKASDEREASGSLDGAAPAARRGVAAASSLIPLCELKKLAIAAGPCSGVLELLGRCACRKCEELQLVVADMLTAAGWGESVDRVVARAGEGRRLRRFRLVVAPRGFFQERRLASWLQPPAEPRAPADESPAAAEPEPKIHPTSWLAALEEFSVDTDDPWILPKAAQLIAAVTRHPAETAGLLVGARLLGRDAPINQRRGADSRPGQDALRHSRESSAGSAEPGSCSRRGNGLACASGCGRCISAPEGEGLRADQPAAAERGGVRSGVRGDSSLERAEVTDSGASYLHTLCAPSEVDPAHHCATDMAVCLRAACLGEDNDPQPACRVEHRASRPSAASGDGGASHSEKHSAQGRYLTQPGDAASGADPFSVSPTPRFPSLRCCSFRCGSTPASGAGCFSWEAVESLLAAALPGCSLRFYGDILFSTCPHTDSPGALSPVSAFCRSSQRKKNCSKGAGNITTGSARTEPLQRDASCDAQGICPVLAKASRGLETPGGGPWGGCARSC
ncbi:hypothetical protein BESB_058550 [Besnoitia besnoiti]|uniref:F-box domain-containing protein n=1 Tax=Besnoitia besnoiti TaxID=94643 RepID=A0A2A9M907_BESBE|nr:hypothetical protein BESB_058550 [Besnoitia besnoiti]PFH34968.1 hypothetical protein BESB_058550 [Besnoitia besnoiti]